MKKLLLFMLAACAFAACEQAPIEEQSAVRNDVPETLTVGFEGDDTRIQLNEAQKTVWTKGDLASVFYKSDGNDCWKFTGETGDRNGSLKRVSAGNYSRRGDYVFVVYPYNPDYLLSLASNTIEATLPAVQEYAAGSFGVGSSPMVAMGDYKQFSLKNTCGWLKLQLTGSGQFVRSITLRGNNGEQVAGDILIVAEDASVVLAEASADINDDEVGGTLLGDDDILREVTLACSNGAMIGSEVTEFYIALPPRTFENGLSVDVECYGYKPTTITTSNKVTIERNHIQPMAVINVDVNSLEPKEEIQSWIGSWTVNSHEVYIINTSGEGTIKAKEDTFTVKISPCTTAAHDVVIDGWSVLGEGWPVYGDVDGDTLYIMNGANLGASQDDSFFYYWLGWYDFGLSIDAIPSNAVTLSGLTATSTNKMIFNGEELTCFASDVFGVSDSGNVYFLIDAFPAVYRTGDMEWKSDKYVDISINFDSITSLTGNDLYEAQYPASYYAAISINANASEIKSVKMYLDKERIITASDLDRDYIVKTYGKDITNDVISNLQLGSALLGPYNLATGDKYVAMFIFETIHGEQYMEAVYTLPNGSGLDLGTYNFVDGESIEYMSLMGAKEAGYAYLLVDNFEFLGVVDTEKKTITLDGYDTNYGSMFNQLAFYTDSSQTQAYGIWSCSDKDLQNGSDLVLKFDENGKLSGLNNYLALCIFNMADNSLAGYGFYFTPDTVITKVEAQASKAAIKTSCEKITYQTK